MLSLLLAGYLLFDKAFAYLHLPGTPLYVGEMVLAVGAFGALTASRYLRVPMSDDPILVLLAVFMLWGLVRFLPEVSTYGIDAVRDSAIWYYCLFALFICAALARSPHLLERLVAQLGRLTPWLLLWLPVALVLQALVTNAPHVPFTTTSVLSHKPNDAAIAALLVLGVMWLFPDSRSARSRALWSVIALMVILLAGTQGRGGLLGAVAGAMVGLAFVRHRLRLILQAVAIMVLGLGIATLLSPQIPFAAGVTGREFSASQLIDNVISLWNTDSPDYLSGTVEDRQQLWSLVFDKQVADGHLIDGSGFGPNLAAEVGVSEGESLEALRNPHNSHLDILARMGLVGLSLWIALWLGWYWRLIAGCQRLARQGQYMRRQVAILSLAISTATLVSTFFDPQLEGPQWAALLWTTFGIGVAVTSVRTWFGDSTSTSESSGRHARALNR